MVVKLNDYVMQTKWDTAVISILIQIFIVLPQLWMFFAKSHLNSTDGNLALRVQKISTNKT